MNWLRPPTIATTLENIIRYLDRLIYIYEYDYDNQHDVMICEKLRVYYLGLYNEHKDYWKGK